MIRSTDHPLASPLLMTKLQIPRIRRDLVSRPRLLGQMDDGFARPLTLVVAPAGSGKTTLIADWLAQRALAAAWVTLDEGDDDPARFWSYVIAALEGVQEGIGEQALALRNSSQADSMQSSLTPLINSVAASPMEFCLVLDDYAAIGNPQVHAALAFLIGHAPPQMHIILATRADPPLPMASWRARGRQVEIRGADLRFTAAEATHLLNTSLGLNLPLGEVTALRNRTEGWITGLQLAALGLREQESSRGADCVSEATSRNRYVIDYFLNEVLRAQEPGVQGFMRQTSLLEELSAPLCNAVTGRADSAEILSFLERAGLFVIPIDAEHCRYRYHRLFADVLQELLAEAEGDHAPELHRRASAWYADKALIPEAIGHALAAADPTRAADLIEQVGMDTLARGKTTSLLDWLGALPAEQLHARPRLCLYFAAASMAAGRFDAAPPLLHAAEMCLSAGRGEPEVEALGSVLAAAKAVFAARSGDEAAVIGLTRGALECRTEDPTGMTGIQSWLRGLAHIFASQTAAVSRTVREAMDMRQGAGESCMTALETYAYGHAESTRGNLSRAGTSYRRALAHLAERGEEDAPVAGLIHLGLGEIARVRHDLAAAESSVLRGLHLVRRWNNGEALVQGYVSFAWLSHAQGDSSGALAALAEAEELVQGRTGAPSLALLNAHRARLLLAQNRHEAAEAWAREVTSRITERGENDGRDLIDRTEFLAWAQLRIIQGRPDEALPGLERLHAAAECASWLRLRLESAALLALAQKAAGETQKALAALEEALSLAEVEGCVAPFTDLGSPMGWLLSEGARRASWRQPHVQSYAARLLAIFAEAEPLPSGSGSGREPAGAASHAAFVAPLVEPLSAREHEVLRLVVSGLSNHEIADRLFIGLATVKTHTHNIYEKFGVQDRQQAVARAVELGLI